jgi:hypothetical protein
MPTIKDIPGQYRFFFYSFDCNEPKHVHVQRERMICKFWLEPVLLSKNHGFSPKELNLIRTIIQDNRAVSTTEVRIKDIRITEDTITAYLFDGRTISVPLAWSWRLSEATPDQRAHYEIIGDGQGVHWPEVDEDISAEGMLYSVPASRPQKV